MKMGILNGENIRVFHVQSMGYGFVSFTRDDSHSCIRYYNMRSHRQSGGGNRRQPMARRCISTDRRGTWDVMKIGLDARKVPGNKSGGYMRNMNTICKPRFKANPHPCRFNSFTFRVPGKVREEPVCWKRQPRSCLLSLNNAES